MKQVFISIGYILLLLGVVSGIGIYTQHLSDTAKDPANFVLEPVSLEMVRAIYLSEYLQDFKHSKFMGDAETPVHGGGDLFKSLKSDIIDKALPADKEYFRQSGRAFKLSGHNYYYLFWNDSHRYYMKVK